MARTTFTDDQLLDAARDLVAQGGARAITLQAVAERAGAPNGSIYHRFRSLDDLIARAWLRAARRTQQAALDAGDEVEDIALAIYDRCLADRADAILLGALGQRDLARLRLSPQTRRDVDEANAPVDGLMRTVAKSTFGRARAADRHLLLQLTVDLPYAFVRRHLEAGTTPPRTDRDRLRAAVRAAMKE
jgi:AcrR family transcriptional regulator